MQITIIEIFKRLVVKKVKDLESVLEEFIY